MENGKSAEEYKREKADEFANDLARGLQHGKQPSLTVLRYNTQRDGKAVEGADRLRKREDV